MAAEPRRKRVLSDHSTSETGAAGKPRSDQRDSMLLHATLRRCQDGDAAPVRIRNLSAGGMMAECDLLLDRGDAVEVSLRNVGIVKAIVAWSVDGRIGVAFDAPIDRLRARRPVAETPARTTLQAPQSRRPGLRTA